MAECGLRFLPVPDIGLGTNVWLGSGSHLLLRPMFRNPVPVATQR